MWRSSLVTTFAVTVSLLVVIAGAAMAYLSETAGRHAAATLAERLQLERLTHTLDHLEHRFAAARGDLLKTGRTIERLGADRPEAGVPERLLLEAALASDVVSSMYLGGLDGGLVAGGHDGRKQDPYFMATDASAAGTLRKFAATKNAERGAELLTLEDFDSRRRPWFEAAEQAGRPTWGDIYVLSTGHDMSLPASMPLSGPDGTPRGVLGADHFVASLDRFLRDSDGSAKASTFIMDTKGFLVASGFDERPFLVDDGGRPTGVRRLARDSASPAIAAAARAIEARFPQLAALTGRHTQSVEVGGEAEDFGVAPFRDEWGLHWIVVTTVSKKTYMPEFIKARQSNLAVIVGALIAVALVALVYGRSVIVPLDELREAAGAVAAGNIASQPDIEFARRDEIGGLAESFNRMLAHLRGAVRDRERALQVVESGRQRAELLLEASQTIVLELAVDGTVVAINRVALELFGFEADEVIGRNCYDVLIAADTREELKRRFSQRVIGVSGFDVTSISEVTTKAGGRLTITWRNVLIRGRDGEVTGVLSTGVDVTELKRDELRLQEALSLALTNEERVRDFATASSDWFWEMDSQLRFTRFFRPDATDPSPSRK
ncbi:MAG: PAS domain S-box protein [Thalassobaculum sp.]|uniref:PAS domain S-box protein n=1 Tax=Thalassobaculum sp. TaxID=2022740 RepID=UPI0032ECF6B1